MTTALLPGAAGEDPDPLHTPSVACSLHARPGVGGVRSRVGVQQSLLSPPARSATFQQRFDARQKIGLSDARLKLGVKDAREKLLQKDARFRIKGKVQDAREMLNSRKQQSTAPPKPRQVADAREKISLKRSSPATFLSPPIGTVTPALKLTKTIQVGAALARHSWGAGNNCGFRQGVGAEYWGQMTVLPVFVQ